MTTEEVAEALGMTVKEVYESRRRNEWPGNLGRRRGRNLIFPEDLTPQEPETTTDPTTAILWALEGIHKTLRAIHTELRGQGPQWLAMEFTDQIDSDGRVWETEEEE